MKSRTGCCHCCYLGQWRGLCGISLGTFVWCYSLYCICTGIGSLILSTLHSQILFTKFSALVTCLSGFIGMGAVLMRKAAWAFLFFCFCVLNLLSDIGEIVMHFKDRAEYTAGHICIIVLTFLQVIFAVVILGVSWSLYAVFQQGGTGREFKSAEHLIAEKKAALESKHYFPSDSNSLLNQKFSISTDESSPLTSDANWNQTIAP